MVKRKDKSKRIKQASKDYLRNNNNSTEENNTKGKKRQSENEESSSSSLAQRERTIQETKSGLAQAHFWALAGTISGTVPDSGLSRRHHAGNVQAAFGISHLGTDR